MNRRTMLKIVGACLAGLSLPTSELAQTSGYRFWYKLRGPGNAVSLGEEVYFVGQTYTDYLDTKFPKYGAAEMARLRLQQTHCNPCNLVGEVWKDQVWVEECGINCLP